MYYCIGAGGAASSHALRYEPFGWGGGGPRLALVARHPVKIAWIHYTVIQSAFPSIFTTRIFLFRQTGNNSSQSQTCHDVSLRSPFTRRRYILSQTSIGSTCVWEGNQTRWWPDYFASLQRTGHEQ